MNRIEWKTRSRYLRLHRSFVRISPPFQYVAVHRRRGAEAELLKRQPDSVFFCSPTCAVVRSLSSSEIASPPLERSGCTLVYTSGICDFEIQCGFRKSEKSIYTPGQVIHKYIHSLCAHWIQHTNDVLENCRVEPHDLKREREIK